MAVERLKLAVVVVVLRLLQRIRCVVLHRRIYGRLSMRRGDEVISCICGG